MNDKSHNRKDNNNNNNDSSNVTTSRCIDVLIIALKQTTRDAGETSSRWYTSTANLQLASLQLCIACRSVISAHVRVDYGTPPTLLAAADEEPIPIVPYTPDWFAWGGHAENLNPPTSKLRAGPEASWMKSRVPVLRVRGVTWQQSPETLMYCGLLKDIDLFVFDAYGYDEVLEYVVWPPGLKRLVLGGSFVRPVDWLSWPKALEELTFRGAGFDQAIDKARWPATLKRLTFGSGFNQPIDKVVWPASLQQLTFGHGFNQPIENITWRAAYFSLTHLTFGDKFDQPITSRVRWPTHLKYLKFGNSFNREISHVVWPVTLRSLEFGSCFNQPVTAIRWPAALRRLTFGTLFNQPLNEVAWPAKLEELAILTTGEKCANSLRVMVHWPIRLKKFTIDTGLGLGLVILPPGVDVCRRESDESDDF